MDILKNVLEYLVTARARRRLLELLWSEHASGSTSELAERAAVGFASAYRELQAMRRLDLVVGERRNGVMVFSANLAHPQADALRKLLTVSDTAGGRRDEPTRERVAALGAPVLVRRRKATRDVEGVLVEGVALAHKDPGLARSLPVAFYRQREHLDPKRLVSRAREHSEKAAVGLFLDLTAELSGDHRFADWARAFRDRRRHAKRPFFHTRAAALQASTQPDRSPGVARRWGYRLDLPLEDFRSLFEKARRAS
jgi:hypothetical protein